MKSNAKSVRLSDRATNYIESYRGASFTDKLENIIFDNEEHADQLIHQWENLQAQIAEKRGELQRIAKHAQQAGEVDRRFTALTQALIQLLSTGSA